MSKLSLPRDSTRQAETLLLGDVSRLLHRTSGIIIILFVLVHVMAQSLMLVPQWQDAKEGMPWLSGLQKQHWVHAVLYSSIAFHSLYGLRLLLGDLGYRFDYRRSLWMVTGVSAFFAIRELVRYAGY